MSDDRASGALLEVRGLCAGYGAAQVLFGVDLEVRRGEVVALLGRNGAGKSTTLKSIMGLLPRRRGGIRFSGRDISGAEPYRIARLGLGYVPEERRIFTDLTVRENLEVGRRTAPPRRGATAWTVQRIVGLFPNLGEMLDRSAARMSGGEQQMLTVARTLMGNPVLLLLDEPSEGVAPLVVEQMAQAVLEFRRAGLGILLCEQNMHFAELVSDRACVLEKGQVRFAGSFGELAANEPARRAWLGV